MDEKHNSELPRAIVQIVPGILFFFRIVISFGKLIGMFEDKIDEVKVPSL